MKVRSKLSMGAISEYFGVEKMLVKYTVSEFLSAKGSFSSIDARRSDVGVNDFRLYIGYGDVHNVTRIGVPLIY